jgi:hypothetical protein
MFRLIGQAARDVGHDPDHGGSSAQK